MQESICNKYQKDQDRNASLTTSNGQLETAALRGGLGNAMGQWNAILFYLMKMIMTKPCFELMCLTT